MSNNFHTPHQPGDVINDAAVNYNRPLGELDQARTDLQAGAIALTKLKIGSASPAASAIVDMSASNKGWTPPALTTTERDAISNPPQGLIIFNETLGSIQFYDGSNWMTPGAPQDLLVIANGTFSGAATTTISNIPSTYTHLKLRLTIAPDSNDAGEFFNLRFNGDSTSGNYSYNHNYNANIVHQFTGDSVAVRYMNEKTSNAANIRAEYLFDILDYTDTDIPTGILYRGCFVLSGAETVYYMRGGASFHAQPFEVISSISFGSPSVNTSGKWSLYGI